jgi:hypothetical protein
MTMAKIVSSDITLTLTLCLYLQNEYAPLHWAASSYRRMYHKTVDVLLREGANANAVDKVCVLSQIARTMHSTC